MTCRLTNTKNYVGRCKVCGNYVHELEQYWRIVRNDKVTGQVHGICEAYYMFSIDKVQREKTR